jgi:hypothetical protein
MIYEYSNVLQMGLYNNLHVLGISSMNMYINNFIPYEICVWVSNIRIKILCKLEKKPNKEPPNTRKVA